MAPSVPSFAGVRTTSAFRACSTLSFCADTFGHTEFDAVSFGGANHSEGDAGISRGRFEDDFAFGEPA